MNKNTIHDKIDILIIEDNPHVRKGWETALSAVPGFNIVGSFGNCENALQSEDAELANVALMDIGLPGMSGIEGARILHEKYPGLNIIMCTVHEDNDKIFDAVCAGAVGYLLKRTPAAGIVAAIREAHRGGSPMTPSVARKVITSFRKPAASSKHKREELTERECQVLERLSLGKNYSVIADSLCLSRDGVGYHIRHIYEKLQVHTRAEAVAIGLKKKLINPPR